MRGATFIDRRRPVDRRPDQRVSKGNGMVNLDQALVLRLLEHLETRSDAFGRSPKARHVADVVGRREQQNATRGFGQLAATRARNTSSTDPGDPLGCSSRRRRRTSARGEAPTMRADSRARSGSAIPSPSLRHFRPRAASRASAHLDPRFRSTAIGQACTLEAPRLPLPCRDQHSDRFRQQTAGHEDKRVGRGPIQPLGVVDQAKDRAVARRLSKQAEERERAQETSST